MPHAKKNMMNVCLEYYFSHFVSIFHDIHIVFFCVCVHLKPQHPIDMTCSKWPLGVIAYVKPLNVSISAVNFLMMQPVSLKRQN